MRNLKKFLALVLAMVMAFSLLLTANATTTGKDFSDATEIEEKFVEAAEVLTGMNIFQGDEEAPTFRPKDSINRAEVAALVYRLATGDTDTEKMDLYTTTHPFTDVNADDWFAGYVGYCWNAGYIKGTTATTFDPYASVTGYETLAMVLRAMGYDKNDEFTGNNWIINVSATATQRGLLDDIKSTHYANTLYLASSREVVASILFQAAQKTRVVYTPAFGYQSGDHTDYDTYSAYSSLGWLNFGLTSRDQGIVIGNQQTGEKNTRLGFSGSADKDTRGIAISSGSAWSAYTWTYAFDADSVPYYVIDSNGDPVLGSYTVARGANDIFDVETGIDLIGHRLKIWYDGRAASYDATDGRPTYAYYDKADTAVVYADNTDLTSSGAGSPDDIDLGDAIKDEGFKVSGTKTAVFNNSFGKFGTLDDDQTAGGREEWVALGNGVASNGLSDVYASPVGLYKIIDNDDDKVVDAVIALNIESSQITESISVNRVPTIGLPVSNFSGDQDSTTPANGHLYVLGDASSTPDENLQGVRDDDLTGVLAQAALVGNSTSTLGDYEMGIHITGTSPRSVSNNEKIAINNADNGENAYFLLSKVEATVQGTIVAYNTAAGTITLDNGTVLERSMFYDTVVVKNADQGDMSGLTQTDTPDSAIPQGWLWDGTEWVEGYANVAYKFYTDYEGKYLGAERTYGSTFLYGTYQDYSQATSTSTFNYYLTGVTLDGEIQTVKVSKFWYDNDNLNVINSNDDLAVPYRNSSSTVLGMGTGVYKGFAILGEYADNLTDDDNVNKSEYLNNMARLGVKVAEGHLDVDVTIGRDQIVLGAAGITGATDSDRYFTEATKFIVVSGYGTDTVKATVYNGISELRGNASSVEVKLDDSSVSTTAEMPYITDNTAFNKMTYYTESPYTYAQSGDTAMKIDTIILPIEAVQRTGGTGLYYVGDPTAKLVNAWGEDAWKYTLYQDGEAVDVWLTNDPSDAAYRLEKDTFYNLKEANATANDGKPIYTAGYYNAGVWTPGNTGYTNTDPAYLTVANSEYIMTTVRYSATTQNAQAANFSTYDGSSDSNVTMYNVANAKVVNLNIGAKATSGAFSDVQKSQSGEIWPGITNLTTLNASGSINPVTGRPLRVSAVVDPDNPLVVTTIYVCWEQDFT